MPRTLAQAFDEFLRAIELTDIQRKRADKQKIHVRDNLAERLKIDEVFLTGSYGRRTAIRPLNDIDLFILLGEHVHGGLRSDPAIACLHLVLGALQGAYPNRVSMRPQRRSVHVAFSGTSIGYDVVPAFCIERDVYIIPDIDRRSWIKTNPKKHAALCKQADQRAGGMLNRLIKAAKHWNGQHGKNLSSFHLEVMAYEAFRARPASYPEGLAALLAHLARRVHRACPDPAGLGPNLDKGMTQAQRTQLASQLQNAADKLARAVELERQGLDGTVRQAHQILYKLLGAPYPPP